MNLSAHIELFVVHANIEDTGPESVRSTPGLLRHSVRIARKTNASQANSPATGPKGPNRMLALFPVSYVWELLALIMREREIPCVDWLVNVDDGWVYNECFEIGKQISLDVITIRTLFYQPLHRIAKINQM